MGESKRRKAILGDNYGKNPTDKRRPTVLSPSDFDRRDPVKENSLLYHIAVQPAVTLEDHPSLAKIATEAAKRGVKNNGSALFFEVRLDSGGLLSGIGFPIIDDSLKILVGMVLLKTDGIQQSEAFTFYRSIEPQLSREIAIAYKSELQAVFIAN